MKKQPIKNMLDSNALDRVEEQIFKSNSSNPIRITEEPAPVAGFDIISRLKSDCFNLGETVTWKCLNF